MLSQEKFIAGMEYMKVAFITWQFDIQNKAQVNIWYSVVKGLSDEAFSDLVKIYIAHNVNPPKSPREFISVLVDKVVSNAKIKPESALDYVREIVSKRGGWLYEGRQEIYSDLKRYPPLLETVKEFEGELRNMAADDTYTADRFRRAYEIKLRANAIRQVDTALGLTMPDEKKLLPGFLPYEQ